MDLFIQPQPVEFKKVALEVSLPEDPNMWPTELLQELYKQVPYISDFEPHIVMDRVDAEQGYGFGYAEIGNKSEVQLGESPAAMKAAGLRQVRIPLIIKDGKLQALDLLVTDDAKVLPLTEERLRSAIFRPQMFDVTSQTPGDQSMVGQLYPPFRQNFGHGGGGMMMNAGMGKEANAFDAFLLADPVKEKQASQAALQAYMQRAVSHGRWGKESIESDSATGLWDRILAKTATAHQGQSLLQAVLPSIAASDFDEFKAFCSEHRAHLTKNAAALLPSIRLLLDNPPSDGPKLASVLGLFPATVVQLSRRLDGAYLAKHAHAEFWDPQTAVIDRGQAVKRYGEKVVLAADLDGAATVAEGVEEPDESVPEQETAAPITETGMYKVWSEDGQELIGAVLANLVDMTGRVQPLKLFTNGSQSSVQGDILGVPVEAAPALPDADVPSGTGFFFGPSSDPSLGPVQATVPLTIKSTYQAPATRGGVPGSTFQAETFDGTPVAFTLQPNLQMVEAVDGETLIPDSWRWSLLGSAEGVALLSAPPNAEAEEALASGGAGMPMQPEGAEAPKQASVTVRADSSGTFTFSGGPVAKLASADLRFLNIDQAMFLLAGLGAHQGYGVEKLAEAITGRRPVTIKVARALTPFDDQFQASLEKAAAHVDLFAGLKANLWKEASEIPDPTAVDTVLSLGFLNPENIITFVSYLPVIDDAQRKMCELLLAVRLGQADISPTALERAVRTTEEVLVGLKALAFQQN